jgi:hypothetical protein
MVTLPLTFSSMGKVRLFRFLRFLSMFRPEAETCSLPSTDLRAEHDAVMDDPDSTERERQTAASDRAFLSSIPTLFPSRLTSSFLTGHVAAVHGVHAARLELAHARRELRELHHEHAPRSEIYEAPQRVHRAELALRAAEEEEEEARAGVHCASVFLRPLSLADFPNFQLLRTTKRWQRRRSLMLRTNSITSRRQARLSMRLTRRKSVFVRLKITFPRIVRFPDFFPPPLRRY